jgi:hypothetical protein
MIHLGPITIMRSKTQRAYHDAILAAWGVHYAVNYGQPNDDYTWKQLVATDAVLSEALSHTPAKDAP